MVRVIKRGIGGGVEKLRNVDPKFQEGLVSMIDGYRPWEQVRCEVRRNSCGGVLVIRDTYLPPVQKGEGEKLVYEHIPGGSDSYVVGTLDGRAPSSVLFEGYGADRSFIFGRQFNDPKQDRTLVGVQAGYTFPEVEDLWRKRMGVSAPPHRIFGQNGGGESYLGGSKSGEEANAFGYGREEREQCL